MCAAPLTVDELKLAAVFEQHPAVIAAWLFGSAPRDDLRPDSDVDIGVLFAAPPDPDTLLSLRADLQDVISFAEIDLVPLNGAGPIWRFEAISGRSLFCRDLVRRAGFASLTAREYEDAMALAAFGLAR